MRKRLFVGKIAAVVSALVLAGTYVAYKATGQVPLIANPGPLTTQPADRPATPAGVEAGPGHAAEESPDPTPEITAIPSPSASLALSPPAWYPGDGRVSPVWDARTLVPQSSVPPITVWLPPPSPPLARRVQDVTSADAMATGPIARPAVPGSTVGGLDAGPGAWVWDAKGNVSPAPLPGPRGASPQWSPPAVPKRRTLMMSGSKSAGVFDDRIP